MRKKIDPNRVHTTEASLEKQTVNTVHFQDFGPGDGGRLGAAEIRRGTLSDTMIRKEATSQFLQEGSLSAVTLGTPAQAIQPSPIAHVTMSLM
jgi:hypothetical protein